MKQPSNEPFVPPTDDKKAAIVEKYGRHSVRAMEEFARLI